MSRLDLTTAKIGQKVIDLAGRKGELREIVPHVPVLGPVFRCAMVGDPDPDHLTVYALNEVALDDNPL